MNLVEIDPNEIRTNGDLKIMLSNDRIPTENALNHCEGSRVLILSANEDSRFVDLSIFTPLMITTGITKENLEREILGNYDCILLYHIPEIDKESVKYFRNLIEKGMRVVGICDPNSFLKNFNKIKSLISKETEFILDEIGLNNYSKALIQILSKSIVIQEKKKEKISIEEEEIPEEIVKIINLVPKQFLMENGKSLYKRILEFKKLGIVKEGPYSFYLEKLTPSIRTPLYKSPDGMKILREYAKYAEEKLNSSSLPAFLHYYGGDWENAAKNLRVLVVTMFQRKEYESVSQIFEILSRISEISDDDNFYLGISLYHLGKQRRALKILENLNDKGYFNNNWDRAKYYLEVIFDYYGFTEANKFLGSIESATSKEGMVELYRNFVKIALDKGDVDEAEMAFSRLKDIIEISDFDCELLRLFGNLYLQKNKTNLALRYYEKAYEISLLKNDKTCMAKSLNNMGILNYQTLNLKNSLDYYEKSRQISRELGDETSYATTTGNMIPIALELKDLDRARSLLRELEKINDRDSTRIGLANGYYAMADVYLNEWDTENALKTLRRGLYLSLERSNFVDVSDFLFKISFVEEVSGIDNSYTIYLAQRFGDKYSESYAFWTGEIELLRGNFQSAYLQLRKALKRVEKSGNIAIIQEDEFRIRFLEYILYKKVPDSIKLENIFGEDRMMYAIINNYIGATFSEEETVKNLNKLPKFYRDMGKAILKGLQGVHEDFNNQFLERLNKSIIEALS